LDNLADNSVLAKKILTGEIDGATAWVLQINGGKAETNDDFDIIEKVIAEHGYKTKFLNYPIGYSSNIDITGKRISIEIKENRMVKAGIM